MVLPWWSLVCGGDSLRTERSSSRGKQRLFIRRLHGRAKHYLRRETMHRRGKPQVGGELLAFGFGVGAGDESPSRRARSARGRALLPILGMLVSRNEEDPPTKGVSGGLPRSEPVTRIELACPAWEAGALPLSYTGARRPGRATRQAV